MIDRGIIKWQPFNSSFNSLIIVEDIKKEKDYINFPTLSEDQLETLEEEINEAYNLKEKVSITYYYKGKVTVINGYLRFLDKSKKRILINQKYIYLKQILEVSFL